LTVTRGVGAGILNFEAVLTVSDCVVAGNDVGCGTFALGGCGAAIIDFGSTTVRRCAVSNNQGTGIQALGLTRVENSTISANTGWCNLLSVTG